MNYYEVIKVSIDEHPVKLNHGTLVFFPLPHPPPLNDRAVKREFMIPQVVLTGN